MVFGVAVLKEHPLTPGFLTHALDQTGKPHFHLPIGVMSKKKKAIRSEDQRSRSLYIHTTGSINYWRNGKSRYNFYKRLAAILSEKRDVPNSKMIAWIRCRVSFSLLRASAVSIRGARSSATRGPLHEPTELQATEGQLENAQEPKTLTF